ncbi:MAG: hypothetical protein ACOC3X_01165 [Nanoarchaeota archaeon]
MTVKKLFLLITIFLFIISCSSDKNIIDNQKINLTLGYCPTMKPYVDEFININNEEKIVDNIELIPLDTTASALKQLNQNNLDLVIVGRTALDTELINKNEIKLKKSYTLIYQTKQFIDYSVLNNLTIHTYLPKEIVKNYFLEENIVFYDSLEEISKNEIIFIDWDDFTDDMQLLIPIHNNQKIINFRIPIIYYDNEKEDKINELANLYFEKI